MKQAAKIFLSEERGVTHSSWMRSYNTFDFGAYKTKYKRPVNNLYVLNDDTLAPGKQLQMTIEEDTLLLLLPVAGAVIYHGGNNDEQQVVPGNMLWQFLSAGEQYTISNPYPGALVNFLQVWIKAGDMEKNIQSQLQSFDIDTYRNVFVKNVVSSTISVHIGKFTGRIKTGIVFTAAATTCFAFVIEGAFELEEILLHARDGLALWKRDSIEMESLSNDAIMLLIEMRDAA